MDPHTDPSGSPLRLPAPWTTRSGITGLAASIACLPLGGCILVGGGEHKFEARDRMTLTEPAGARKIILHNQVGNVHLTAEPSATEITATAFLIGRGRHQSDADQALAEINVTLDPSRTDPTIIEARADAPNRSRRRSHSVEWRITAPPNIEIEVHNDVGDIEVAGFVGRTTIESNVGDITAIGMTQGLTVVNDVGRVDARAAGPVSIKTNVGDADLYLIEGPLGEVSITTKVGEIALALPQHWTGALRADTHTGDVNLSLAGMPLKLTKDRDHRAEGTIGEGGPSVVLSADVGDIEIRRATTN
ncbi:MAG: DUF4097 family beta strand repeat protein [Phycisphaerae bacterium]|nr:DUF4097 family beta strand repeat protein [Phycisphaerae bacterium]